MECIIDINLRILPGWQIQNTNWKIWNIQNKEIQKYRNGVCSWYLFAGSGWMTNLPLLSYCHAPPAPQTCSTQKRRNGDQKTSKREKNQRARSKQTWKSVFFFFRSKFRGVGLWVVICEELLGPVGVGKQSMLLSCSRNKLTSLEAMLVQVKCRNISVAKKWTKKTKMVRLSLTKQDHQRWMKLKASHY